MRPHDAAVVRCSSCGAPRREGNSACSFCGSDFTLHERDLHTICPGCMARISDRARFCHGCGQPIAPQAVAGEPTDHACPACGGEWKLYSRSIADDGVTVFECRRCAGLWLGREVFKLLEERALDREASWVAAPGPGEAGPQSRSAALVYRPCIECGKLMNRRNYGRKSGVILDVCAAHGIWFDHGELDRVLRWIREGGLARTRTLEREELAARERAKRLEAVEATEPPLARPAAGRGWIDLVGSLVDFLTG